MISNQHPKILLFRDYYLPGFKSGGPIQTVANLVANLGDEFSFHIVTRDRDSGDPTAYPSVHVDQWNQVGKAQVYYASPGKDFGLRLTRLWRDLDPDVVYLNSFFSPGFTILPLLLRRAGLVPNARTIVAPRGEFHGGALDIKSTKKRIYRRVADLAGLYKDVDWCATNEAEADFIRQRIRGDAPVRVAPNLGALKAPSRDPDARPKKPGAARFVVVARVSPIKNLHRSIQLLSRLDGVVQFDIYGPVSDDAYWQKCQRAIADAPANIQIEYRGPIPHPEVHERVGEYDFFLMPSSSENHGHAIVEAMLAGCPPIISTGTPWRHLQHQNVGWDLSLDHDREFIAALQRCVDMGPDEYAVFSQGTHDYGRKKVCSPEALAQNHALFALSTSL